MLEIKTELLENISHVNSTIRERAVAEIEFLSLSRRSNGTNNLESFYKIWKDYNGQKGDNNAVNSWLAYALGMTSVKPVDKSFKSRRFFARPGFPDIDSDFGSRGRDQVIRYVENKYGPENVGHVGTWSMLSLKNVTKRAVKVFDLAGAYHKGPAAYVSENEAISREISKTLDPYQRGAIFVAKDEEGNSLTDKSGKEIRIKTVRNAYDYVPEFRAYIDKCPEMLARIDDIEGLVSQFGVHASGVVLSDVPLSSLAPLRPAKEEKISGVKVVSYATQYSYDDLEQLGLIKFDFLAITTLDVVEECLKLIKNNYDIDIDIEKIPFDDQKTFDLFQRGHLVGVFQCEGYGMQKTCREIGVDRFEDIVAIVAMYRPGPMGSIPEYVARKKGISTIDYFHPSIEPFVKPYLQKTYGVLCYQEQLMQICNSLAGFSITDGYGMIKAVGKKLVDLMKSYEKLFVSGCIMNGVPPDVAQNYWDMFITPFAFYGFNLSHSLCYGANAYLTGYLKANFTEEFMCAYLNVMTWYKKWKKVVILERDCKKMGIEISKRSVNNCAVDWTITRHKNENKGILNSEIRPSLMCKDMSETAAIGIAASQPYKDLQDFARRVGNSVNTASVLALCETGFFPKKKADSITKEFEMIRTDVKKCDKKGVPSGDMYEEQNN